MIRLHPPSLRLSTALLSLLLLAASSGLLSTSASAASTRSSGHADRPRWHDVTWTNTAPPITIGAPQCDAGGQCLYPWTEVGVAHGDFEGTYIASGVATINAAGALAVSRIDILTGTVAGCGTGSMVLRMTEDLGPSPQPSQWAVVKDFGTGGLAGVRGQGQGIGGQTPDGLTTTLSGWLACPR